MIWPRPRYRGGDSGLLEVRRVAPLDRDSSDLEDELPP